MDNQYKYKNSILFLFLMFLASLIMGVGYAAINSITLTIQGAATASPDTAVYISNVTFVSDSNGEHENCSNTYTDLTLTSEISLDNNINSYVEYQVEVLNATADTYIFNGISTNASFYSNENIIYETTNLPANCEMSPKSTITFNIKFKYKENLVAITNTTLNSTISLNFAKAFIVTYNNISGDFPNKAYNGKNLTINIGNKYDYVNITINGVSYEGYTYSNGVLTIPGADINGNIVIEPVEDNGEITATFSETTINLTNTDSKIVGLQINSTYSRPVNVTFTSSNNAFDILDANGNSLSTYTIAGNTTQSYSILIKRKNSEYTNNTENLYVTLNGNNGDSVNTNTLIIQVPKMDTNPPVINAITLNLTESNGDITVSWSGSDETAGTNNYTVILYNESGQVATATESSNSINTITHTFSGVLPETLSYHNYYVKIYGVDVKGNSGASYLDVSTTSSTYCRKSADLVIYSIATKLTDINIDNSNKYIKSGEKFEATLSYSGSGLAGGSVKSSSVNVTMGTQTVISGGKSNNTNIATYASEKITINSVTGNLSITAEGQGSCLIEGTEITLANGNKKKIEDVGYDDLLLVWNYETGKATKEYPIWIEKEEKTEKYQLTTFSDGTILKTLGYHGVFSLDLNMFISVDDCQNFKVGTNIAKINKSKDGFDSIKVEKIEYVQEPVYYYHVVSTRYYNVIANDILTTDGNTVLSNLYGFKDNITWANDRETKNIYDYSEFENIMPYYMFKGLRVEEGKYLEENLPKEIFIYYLKRNQLNPDMLLQPLKNKDGNNIWMVTTDNDIITETNKSEYLRQEGTYYKVPEPKNKDGFISWYNTADGKIYQPGDNIQIWTGTHLILIKEQ